MKAIKAINEWINQSMKTSSIRGLFNSIPNVLSLEQDLAKRQIASLGSISLSLCVCVYIEIE
jgi:hypothetical protein